MNYIKQTLSISWFGIKNNRVLAGIMFLACVLILPGFTIINDMHYDMGHIVRDYGIFIAYIAGIIIPMVLYSYVQRRRECDFYNSMPVKRSQYFWGYFISGFLLFLVPFTLLSLIHFLFGGDAFEYYLPIMGIFTVIYCSMITAVVFSGSVLSTLISFVLRNTAAVAVVMLPIIMAGADLGCYMQLLADKICILTPAAAIYFLAAEDYGGMFWQLVIAAAELVIGFLLHRFRKSESTTALAYPKIRYVYQYLVMLIAALLVDALILGLSSEMYLYSERSYDNIFQSLDSEELALTVFFTVVAVFLVFIVMNMILDRSGTAAFKKFRHFFIFLAGYAGLLALLFSTLLNALPPFILPFEPDGAVVVLKEFRPATAEEAALINKGEWAYSENGEFLYGLGKDGFFVENGESFYAVTDREKTAALKEIAQSGRKDGITLYGFYSYGGGDFEGKEFVGRLSVIFLETAEEFSAKESDYLIELMYGAEKREERGGYIYDLEGVLRLTDISLKGYMRSD